MIHPGRYSSVGALLWDALVQYKSETALIEVSRKRERHRYSYLDVKHRAMSLARHLEAHDLGAGDRVALLMSNQSAWLICALAVFYRGCVLVPLDYKLTGPEQRALLVHCGATALITEYGLYQRLESPPVRYTLVTEAPSRVELPADVHLYDEVSAPQPDLPAATAVHREREDCATIVYSSGTGGQAKGCMLPHRAYLAQYHALIELFPMEPGQVFFSILPTNHAIDFMAGFIGPFCCGATVVHQRTLRPEHLRSTLRTYKPTHMAVVPALLTAFERSIDEALEALPAWQRTAIEGLADLNDRLTRRRPRRAISQRLLAPVLEAFGGQLHFLFCGGAYTDRKRAEAFYRLGIPIAIGYGQTEACTVLTVNDLRPFRGDTVGKPVRGVEVRIVDPDVDGVGEVQVRGDTLMLGYLDDPELTAATFDGDWLKTGDLGRLDASFHLQLMGRSKNMIVTAGGKNIYPEDIEASFERVPCEELAVFAADYLWPRGSMVDEDLIAVLRPEQGKAWRGALREANLRLPEFKRISGVVVVDEEFPRTASMKLKRNVLAEHLRTLSRDAVDGLGPQ